MNPASEDMKDMVVDSSSGLSYVFGTDLFIAQEPASPDVCVTIIDSGGELPDPANAYEVPHVQIRIRGARGNSYKAAWQAAHEIKQFFHRTANMTVNSTWYVGIWAIGEVNPLGFDDSQRPIFTVNFRVHRKIS